MKQFIFVIFICFSNTLLADFKENLLLGEWVPATNSRQGFGQVKNYQESGLVSVDFGVILHYKYKLSDGKFALLSNPEIFKSYSISDNILTLSYMNARGRVIKEQKLMRLKGKKGQALVGSWSGKHSTGKTQTMEFTQKMDYYFSIFMKSSEGTYKVIGNKLIESYIGQKDQEWDVELKNGILSLSNHEKKKVLTFKKKAL